MLSGSVFQFSESYSSLNVTQEDIHLRVMSFCDGYDDENIGEWNTQGIVDMSNLFYECEAFRNSYSSWDFPNFSQWDVSSVTDMRRMFYNCESFDESLDSWDVSHVTSMNRMFHSTHDFNQPLDSWDVSHVTGMGKMFHNAWDFNRPLDSWDVSRVSDMAQMFNSSDQIHSSFNQPLGSWDVSLVTSIYYMINSNQDYHTEKDLSQWNLTSITTYEQCEGFFNHGCNPPLLVQLGCVSTCCPTQVANSNWASPYSISGQLNDTFDVICDPGHYDGGNTTCDPDTGFFSAVECTGIIKYIQLTCCKFVLLFQYQLLIQSASYSKKTNHNYSLTVL